MQLLRSSNFMKELLSSTFKTADSSQEQAVDTETERDLRNNVCVISRK